MHFFTYYICNKITSSHNFAHSRYTLPTLSNDLEMHGHFPQIHTIAIDKSKLMIEASSTWKITLLTVCSQS